MHGPRRLDVFPEKVHRQEDEGIHGMLFQRFMKRHCASLVRHAQARWRGLRPVASSQLWLHTIWARFSCAMLYHYGTGSTFFFFNSDDDAKNSPSLLTIMLSSSNLQSQEDFPRTWCGHQEICYPHVKGDGHSLAQTKGLSSQRRFPIAGSFAYTRRTAVISRELPSRKSRSINGGSKTRKGNVTLLYSPTGCTKVGANRRNITREMQNFPGSLLLRNFEGSKEAPLTLASSILWNQLPITQTTQRLP